MIREDPGVPGARRSALEELVAKVGAERVDTLWHFPPLRKGRRESGLLVAGLFPADADTDSNPNPNPNPDAGVDADDPETPRRVVVTLAWRAEETGTGVSFQSTFQEEGEAPPDHVTRVIAGVARRMDEAAGEPRYLQVGGDSETLRALMEEPAT